MEDVTIISYPSTEQYQLLSLTEGRSKYMLPFCGKFRVVDFIIGNAMQSGARRTVVYNDVDDDLVDYVSRYGPFEEEKFPPFKVVTGRFSDAGFTRNIIMDSNTGVYIIYNGDNPSLIDFAALLQKFKKSRAHAVLYKLQFNGKATMAHRALVARQKVLNDVIKKAIREKNNSPNIFEMIINTLINKGIKKDTFPIMCWPVNNVPDYYRHNMEILHNRDVVEKIFYNSMFESKIEYHGYASLGNSANVSGSFVSDGCVINGTVENSILFPGVSVEEKAVIRNSIILPHNRIGEGSRITRTVLDERTEQPFEPVPLNIGIRCRIGTDTEQLKSSSYPRALFKSITLVGKNCSLPEGVNVGGASYVASGKTEEDFVKKKYIYDGLSLE